MPKSTARAPRHPHWDVHFRGPTPGRRQCSRTPGNGSWGSAGRFWVQWVAESATEKCGAGIQRRWCPSGVRWAVGISPSAPLTGGVADVRGRRYVVHTDRSAREQFFLRRLPGTPASLTPPCRPTSKRPERKLEKSRGQISGQLAHASDRGRCRAGTHGLLAPLVMPDAHGGNIKKNDTGCPLYQQSAAAYLSNYRLFRSAGRADVRLFDLVLQQTHLPWKLVELPNLDSTG